ncbi:MAG: hypothetical protein NTY77_05630 [Elusimicrobia bacterium]|nr:hypothetical protein [Elusimicrobiota bacterium]
MPLPDMSPALAGLTDQATFKVTGKVAQDHVSVETESDPVPFQGAMFPMKPQQVEYKPEGQRSWRWEVLVSSTRLKVDYIVTDDEGVQFRVAAFANWRKAGFYQYDLHEWPAI